MEAQQSNTDISEKDTEIPLLSKGQLSNWLKVDTATLQGSPTASLWPTVLPPEPHKAAANPTVPSDLTDMDNAAAANVLQLPDNTPADHTTTIQAGMHQSHLGQDQ